MLLVYIITLYLSSRPSNTNGGMLADWGIRHRPLPDNMWPNRTWIGMIPAAVAAGGSLPMLLEGVLHMPSLPVLAMIYVRTLLN